ncbi:MAG: glucose-6-phosphate dehydrogenase, partial [Janthinobacterium lividum]
MSKIIPVPLFDFIIFGATGDLTLRKLLPALFHRFRDGQIPPDSRIIGVARSRLDDAAYRDRAAEALRKHVDRAALEGPAVSTFLQIVHYVSLDGAAPDGDWSPLQTLVDPDRVRVFYLATSPELYGGICQALTRAGLATGESRVVLEKPIGHDLASAQAINDEVGKHFPEARTFRIDHFLGKETVQNLLALRFANTIFERLWTADVIDHVQVTVSETVGVEGRGGYYDHSGALRDMLQNHMLQLVCLLAMEPPVSLEADAVRDEKLKVLRTLRPMAPHEVPTLTVRGQYGPGAVDGKAVPGYLADLNGSGTNEPSTTETFVAMKAELNSRRWAGVPFYLRTGKRLPQKLSEIVVQFRGQPFSIFPNDQA